MDMAETMRHVDVGGARLAYREVGQGEPVVLLHPGFVAAGMHPLLQAPALEGWRLIAVHRRGYGQSDRVNGPVSIVQQAADVTTLLDHLGIRQSHLVGHSFGANVALQFAVSQPQRLGALVLMEPLLGFLLRPETAAYVGAAAAEAVPRFAAGDHAGALDVWLNGAFGPGFRDVLDRALPGAWETAVADAPTAFATELPALQEWPFGPDDLGSIHIPTLSVVNSGTYWPGFRETHAALLDRLPDAEGVEVSVDSHLLQIAEPAPVADAVAGFLRRHPLG